ncbi:MAG: DUF4430 domain-containing protein [Ruminococcus sp.]|nr:DUF4430 domain-containing protein [Ruminococcus sp.]
MRNKAFKGIVSCLAAAVTFVSVLPFEVNSQEYTVGEVQSLIDGIIDYKINSVGAGSVQDWLNGDIADNAGTLSEWYAISLSQDGYSDLSAYESALSAYLSEHNEPSPTSREKYALALSAAGSRNSYISDILDTSVGEQGIMSYIYGLHVLNNGYTCSRYTADDVVSQLLSMQYSDGGWAIFGDYGDIDVTAMTITALAPYYNSNGSVHDAVERGVDFLSQRQQDNGGYQSFGTPNPESAAQVLVAVSAVGIDCVHDGRFIKNDNNLIDGIVEYRLGDGSFCHTQGGETNETATVQALYSFIAYKRMCEGKTSLLLLDNRQSAEPSVQEENVSVSVQHDENVQGGDDKNSGSTTNERTENIVASTVTTDKKAAISTSAVSTLTTMAKTTTKKICSAVTTENSTSVSAVSTSSAVTSAVSAVEDIPQKSGNSKAKAIIIIVGSAAVLSLILLIIGKRSYKNFLFIILAAGAASAVVIFTDIRSADEYYNGSSAVKENAIGTVTLEIRCDTIVGKSDDEHIPDDGTILAVTDFDIEEGDTVFDVLTDAAQTYGIQMENKGSAGSTHGMVYISGINYIYEYDFGDLSGWVYHVNGITPSRNCGEYVLSDGDQIQWLYTCELGHDLNEVYEDDRVF